LGIKKGIRFSPKEVQIRASREKDPEKQMEILNKVSEEGKTVRQIRKEEKDAKPDRKKQIPASNNQKFQEWYYRRDQRRSEFKAYLILSFKNV
jgi:beta-lactamase class D